jgi:hypothetical protein
LNEYFTNVCELDLLFNFYKVYALVDEMFLAGEIEETSHPKVRLESNLHASTSLPLITMANHMMTNLRDVPDRRMQS